MFFYNNLPPKSTTPLEARSICDSWHSYSNWKQAL